MKKLVRSKKDRKIAGVCGGLGAYLRMDPTIIRIMFVFLALPGGFPGIIPYVLLWIIIPEEK
jgi:phage shock protein PspC (stress-responsive transcriptional regulator)